eukprot:scaffold4498_cov119-Isochrysis_galbana.AAC.17
MAKAYKIRAIIHTRERSGATHPQRLLNRTNHTIGPIFSLDDACRHPLYVRTYGQAPGHRPNWARRPKYPHSLHRRTMK